MPMPLQSTPYGGPWRGLMRRRRTLEHPLSYGVEALNVELLGDALGKRRGTQMLSDNPCAGRIHAMHQCRWRAGTGTEELLVAAGTALQVAGDPPSANRFDLTKLPAGTPARVEPTYAHFEQFDNKVFFCDGVNLNLKYTYKLGTPIVEKWGISAPTVAPTTSVSGTGISLATGRKYRYRYRNSTTGAVSEPSAESASTGVVTNKTIAVATTASPDPQVDEVEVYATTDGGGGVWLYVGSAADGGTVNDTRTDAQLGVELEEFLNNPPPTMRFVLAWPHAGRLLGVPEDRPSTIVWSDLTLGQLRGESWPPENVEFLALDTGDELIGGRAFSDSVLLYGRRSIWRIRGVPPQLEIQPVQFDERRTAIGGFSHHALMQVDDTIVSPFLDGAYAASRYSDVEGGFQSTRISRAIDDLWSELNPAATRRAHGIYLRSRKQLRLWVPSGSTTEPVRCLVYQLDIGAEENVPGGWTIWEIERAAGVKTQVTASLVVETPTGDAAYVGTSDGFILVMDIGNSDWVAPGESQGIPYNFVWETVPSSLADDSPNLRLRFLDLVARSENQSLLTITPKTDLKETWGAVGILLEPPPGFRLDHGRLDVDRLGSGAVSWHYRATLLARGATPALRIEESSGTASFLIESWLLRWQPLPLKAREVASEQAQPEYASPQPGYGADGGGTGGYGGSAGSGRWRRR